MMLKDEVLWPVRQPPQPPHKVIHCKVKKHTAQQKPPDASHLLGALLAYWSLRASQDSETSRGRNQAEAT